MTSSNNEILLSDVGNAALIAFRAGAESGLSLLNACKFVDAKMEFDGLAAALPAIENYDEHADERIRNDLFVLRCYARLFVEYVEVWRQIYGGLFSESWSTLQNTLDSLRIVKKFSGIGAEFLETQLLALEKLYPYNVFFSVGMTVEKFECSICGQDIDSDACAHRRGQLYSGRMAQGIVKDIVSMNELSIVEHPADKRCVTKYPNDGEQFKLVRFLSDLLRAEKMQIGAFKRLEFSKKMKPNPDYRDVGRNNPCYCGSGKKFKKCCIDKARVEGDHVDIIGDVVDIRNALVT